MKSDVRYVKAESNVFNMKRFGLGGIKPLNTRPLRSVMFFIDCVIYNVYDAAGLTMNMAKCEYLIVGNEELRT